MFDWVLKIRLRRLWQVLVEKVYEKIVEKKLKSH